MTNQYHPGQTAQAIPLQPKPVNAYREVWRKIRDNGYDVIPLRGRDGPFSGWPTEPNDDDADRAVAAARPPACACLGRSCFVIDLDVRDLRCAAGIDGDVTRGAGRTSWRAACGGPPASTTLALIGQVATARKRRWTARFKSRRRSRTWSSTSPATTNGMWRYTAITPRARVRLPGPLNARHATAELPWFPEIDIPLMISECEQVMRRARARTDQAEHTHCRASGSMISSRTM